MKLATAFVGVPLDQVKSALHGGVLKVYSVARPPDPDAPITRSSVLATFRFATPAFDGTENAVFEENPVLPDGIGTPGFARAYAADGVTSVADLSAGSGNAEIRLSEGIDDAGLSGFADPLTARSQLNRLLQPVRRRSHRRRRPAR